VKSDNKITRGIFLFLNWQHWWFGAYCIAWQRDSTASYKTTSEIQLLRGWRKWFFFGVLISIKKLGQYKFVLIFT
jgi:hypothetical protein